eukprot:gene7142-14538_t
MTGKDPKYPSPSLDQVRFLLRMCPAAIKIKNKRQLSPLERASMIRRNMNDSSDKSNISIHTMELRLHVPSRSQYKHRTLALALDLNLRAMTQPSVGLLQLQPS